MTIGGGKVDFFLLIFRTPQKKVIFGLEKEIHILHIFKYRYRHIQVPVQAYFAHMTTNGVRKIKIKNFKSKRPRGISICSNISKYQRQCVSIRISIRILKTAKHAYFTRNALKRHHQLLLSATRRPLNSAKSRYCGPKQLQTTPLSPKCIGVPTRPPTSATRSIWAHFTSNLTSKPRKHTR